MNLKRKWNRFWTLRRSNDGFTLVELVVVIAILAILAGVGSAGYSGYIKSANKNSDKVLVGNIIRAIETGTNSMAFVNDDSFIMGRIAYPVGFITLSTNGAQVVASATEMTTVDEACEFETISNITIKTAATYDSGCSKNTQGTYYTISTGSISYCKTHSPEPTIESVGGQTYASNYTHTQGNKYTGCLLGCGGITAVNSTYPAGAQVISNQDALYTEKSGGLCDMAYANQYGTFTGSTDVGETTSGALYDAIIAAFGSTDSMKLSYDGWTSEEGMDYASFYTSAPKLMEDMENLSGVLALGSRLDGTLGINLGIEGVYQNEEEVLAGVTNKIVTTHPTQDSWLNQWNNDDGMTWDSYGFGLTGRENYSAARMSYNSAFASYMEANGEGAYADIIRNFYSQSVEVGGSDLGLPGLVCTDAFTDSESPLKDKFAEAGDTDGAAFERIAKLYEEYKNSAACEENGRVLYDTMGTFSDTADIANAYTEMNGGTIFDYYNSYVDEIAALYEAAGDAANGGIVIIVTVDNGQVNCVVSPSAANPRND